MKQNPKFAVTAQTTLLPYLMACFPNKSRNYVKGILKRGQVTVDGTVCRSHRYALMPGQQLEILLQRLPTETQLPMPILYEDDDLIAVDKPAGMLSVATDKAEKTTAYYLVNAYLKKQNPPSRAFIVHRLDRETSGVLLLAKSQQMKYALQDNWNDMVKRRGYVALVEGRVDPPRGRVTSWLKQTKSLLVYSSPKSGDGKKAITNYCVQRTSDRYSLLDITLETGRKNQIRVHMQDMGYPVAGDRKYGASTNPLGRLGLHACALDIVHPRSGVELHLASAVPDLFAAVLTEK